jgi:hypothetical protein
VDLRSSQRFHESWPGYPSTASMNTATNSDRGRFAENHMESVPIGLSKVINRSIPRRRA